MRKTTGDHDPHFFSSVRINENKKNDGGSNKIILTLVCELPLRSTLPQECSAEPIKLIHFSFPQEEKQRRDHASKSRDR